MNACVTSCACTATARVLDNARRAQHAHGPADNICFGMALTFTKSEGAAHAVLCLQCFCAKVGTASPHLISTSRKPSTQARRAPESRPRTILPPTTTMPSRREATTACALLTTPPRRQTMCGRAATTLKQHAPVCPCKHQQHLRSATPWWSSMAAAGRHTYEVLDAKPQ